jgi:hypothetical protein
LDQDEGDGLGSRCFNYLVCAVALAEEEGYQFPELKSALSDSEKKMGMAGYSRSIARTALIIGCGENGRQKIIFNQTSLFHKLHPF